MGARFWLTLGVVLVWSCGGGESGVEDRPAARPPAECDSAWAGEAARDFVRELVAATGSDRPVWGEYDLSDGWYVLHAGASTTGSACLGAWHAGEAVAYAAVPDEPKLLTPLYGYYFSSNEARDSIPLVAAAMQPPPVRTWLEEVGMERAVITPVDVRDFPIVMPALVKAQLAIHEGFHIIVQVPRWHAATGPWPVWDRQPDRAGVRACYAENETVETALGEERESLLGLVTALLDGDSSRACGAGEQFLSRRNARYDMLTEVTVPRHDSTPGSCREAEAIMELEEGTADYASWTVLYDLGQASREQLVQHYQVQQDDVFYLTGAMQLHAIQMMTPEGMAPVVQAIADSRGPEDGAPTAILDRTLTTFCR